MSKTGFDVSAFEKQSFVDRTKTVKVPALSDWFKDGDPVFIVRGLTFDERIKCEALANDARIEAATALAELAYENSGSGDKVKDIKAALGWGDATQPATRVCIERVMIGMVEPKLNRQIVAKISRSFPSVFGELLEAVSALTNEGQAVEKKQQRSGQTKASELA